jgi:osmotically-inducible protein OsmY
MNHRLSALILGIAAVASLSACAPLIVGGAATGAMMADDRRTSATYLMDQEIELKAAGRLRELRLDDVYASFTSFNRRVLITGQAPNEDLKAKVTDVARGLPNVRDVMNEMTIGMPVGMSTHTNDAYVTSKVKARMVDAKQVDFNKIKVVTEDGTVFLMGLVTHVEGDAAANVAAETSGVKRVVKMFEYID